MYGQTNPTAYFSGNAVVSGDGAMARRKGIMTARVAMFIGVIVLVGVLMGGRIFLTNQITGLRTRVADLENQKEFLEAGSAALHVKWNRESSGEIIMKRAGLEMGLIVPDEPGLVLVCVDTPKKNKSGWREVWDVLAVEGETRELVAGAMVSLVPRSARASATDNGGL